MATFRAGGVILAAALASLCCTVTAFTSPEAVVSRRSACFTRAGTSTSPIQPHVLRTRRRCSPDLLVLALPEGGSEGDGDGIEEYKQQMAEFMAQAHEKRVQAMEAVKAEVQRGYEQQIADLQSKLAAPPASAKNGAAAQLVGAAAGKSVQSDGAAVGAGTPQHPGYAARSKRPGWEARWGSEEPVRASTATSTSVSAADVASMEARATATTSNGGPTHPAYAARVQRPGWQARWGNEEVARAGSGARASPAAAGGGASAGVAGATAGAGVTRDQHPAYAARTQRPGWESRWGGEEVARTAGGASVSVSAAAGVQGDVHPAYAARARRPGWEARWGPEEVARMAVKAPSSTSAHQTAAATPAPADAHPAYAARARRPGWEARWGAEEPARMASATAATAAASVEPVAGAPPVAQTAGVVPADAHPAYAARVGRPGWEARWGSEEKERVAGAPAGAIAVEGAAAGFATAGGLDLSPAAAAAGSASSAQGGAQDQDLLVDDLLPNDVDELKQMVVSNRRYFQEYLQKSLAATNDLRQSMAKVDAELSSSTAKLAAEQKLRETLQDSFLEYISRSGNAVAEDKKRIAELEKDAARLATQAEELQRFTQEYMVKASGEKQKAIEEAAASARAQSAERIAALQAQVLELQAGG